jgi:hypothetical protein
MTENWRKFLTAELHIFCSSQNIDGDQMGGGDEICEVCSTWEKGKMYTQL